MMQGTILGLVDGFIPLVLTETIADMRCCIPVLPEGGGEDQPLEKRTARCTHRTTFLIGSAQTCPCHIEYAARLADITLSMQTRVRLSGCLEPSGGTGDG